ncbi:hypothetical protein Tco_1410868 [Tanacetum coccineum]
MQSRRKQGTSIIWLRKWKVESEKAKIVDKPKEQHVSPIKSGRGKGFMCYGDEVANVPNKLKKDVVPRKTRSLTIVEEAVVGELTNSISIQEPRSQRRQRSQLTIDSQTDDPLQICTMSGEKTQRSRILKKSEESANETDDAYEVDMDLSNDNPQGDDAAARYAVFMHNKSTVTPNSTYLIMTVTSSLLDFIQTLLDETHANEFTNFISYPMYTDAHTTLMEMFLDENVHHIPSLLAKKIPYPTTTPQPSSLQAKAKKLMQKVKKNMRKFNFKKAVAHKFREYDQKLEALTNFNIS